MEQFSTSLNLEYPDKIDSMAVITASTKSNMNSGRYLFTIKADQQAKSTLDKLGWDSMTSGHFIHGIRHYLIRLKIEGSIINYIDHRRQMAFLEEQKRNKENKH